MELGPLLARIRSVESLGGLLAALGYEPLREAVTALVPHPGRASGTAALAVGRMGDFPWFAVAGADPERVARRLARRLLARGRIAGVLALDGPGRRLGLAVAFEGTPSMEVRLDVPGPAALACIGRLAGPGGGGALAHAARVAEALSGQAVGRRFFRQFKGTLDRMAEGLPGPARGEDRRSLALLQLTRVLFLLFHPGQGLVGRPRPVPGRGSGSLPRAAGPDPPRPAAPPFLRYPQPAGRRADPGRRSVRRHSLSEWRAVRAAPVGAVAPRRHSERPLARRVRPPVRTLSFRGRRARRRRRHRARHAWPRLRGRHVPRLAPRVRHLLHACRPGPLGARRGAGRGPGSDALAAARRTPSAG